MKYAASMVAAALFPRQTALLLEQDKTHSAGRALGLTDEQVTEVIRAWAAAYARTMWPLPWSDVHSAVQRRGIGQGWQPPAF